VRRAAGARKL